MTDATVTFMSDDHKKDAPANRKKPKKVSRPKLPKGEAKSKIMPVQFTKAEFDHLNKAANQQDKNVAGAELMARRIAVLWPGN